MTATRLRERTVLRKNGRSFFWASRILGRRHAENATSLYAFCRAVDDIVDEGVDEGGAGAADMRLLRAELQGEVSMRSWVRRFRDVQQRLAIAPAVTEHFLDGIERDNGFVRMQDEDDLLHYCYGVAGTVGLMMCAALDVDDSAAYPFAIDLGIAMQLTNICRDVLEDADRDRIYLPQTLVGRHATPGALLRGDPAARTGAAHAIHALLDVADGFYRSADRGLRFLPWRARLAILTASRVYEAIGSDVRARLARGAYWDRRAYVPTRGKFARTANAVLSQLFNRRYWNVGAPPAHRAGLHRALRGLPGAEG